MGLYICRYMVILYWFNIVYIYIHIYIVWMCMCEWMYPGISILSGWIYFNPDFNVYIGSGGWATLWKSESQLGGSSFHFQKWQRKNVWNWQPVDMITEDNSRLL